MQDLTIFIFNHPFLSWGISIVLVLLILIELVRVKRNSFNISPSQATMMMNYEHAVIIDIRNKEQFRTGHIIEAHSITSKDLQDNRKKIERFKGKPLIIVCQAGVESQKIAALLLKEGYNAYSLAGGMNAWRTDELPVVKE